MPHTGWSVGSPWAVSGVRGKWTVGEKQGVLTHTRSNPVYNEKATMDPSAAVGDYTLLNTMTASALALQARTTPRLYGPTSPVTAP